MLPDRECTVLQNTTVNKTNSIAKEKKRKERRGYFEYTTYATNRL